jgi:hypothetical protein
VRTSLLVSLAVALGCACGKVVPADGDGPDIDPIDAADAPPVDAETDAEIDAEVDGPSGGFIVTPAGVDYGFVPVGETRSVTGITVTNAGDATELLVAMRVFGDDFERFAIEKTTCGSELEPDEECTLTLSVRPTAEGTITTMLEVSGPSGTAQVPLTADGIITGGITMAPAAHDFGANPLGGPTTFAFGVTATGSTALPAPTISTSGGNAFSVQSHTCSGPLQPGVPCTVTVAFQPAQIGAQTGSLVVSAGGADAVGQLGGVGSATLAVTKLGAGTGTVSGGGIQCGASCTTSPSSSTVTLTAVADIGSHFAGWGGSAALCGANVQCNVAIDAANVNVTATFGDSPTLRILVANPPDTEGKVTFGAETCDNDCTYDFQGATPVNLGVIDGQAFCATFLRWELGCTGTAPMCNFNLAADTTVRAVFSHRPGCTLP